MRPFARLVLAMLAMAALVTVAAAQPAQVSRIYLPAVSMPPTPEPSPSPTTPPPAPVPSPEPTSAPRNFDNNGDGRVTCADFSTRAQALEALRAGYTNLDNDGDGIPCESLR